MRLCGDTGDGRIYTNKPLSVKLKQLLLKESYAKVDTQNYRVLIE